MSSDQDPLTRGGDRLFHELVPGCSGQTHREMHGGGHCLQESLGAELARGMLEWMLNPGVDSPGARRDRSV